MQHYCVLFPISSHDMGSPLNGPTMSYCYMTGGLALRGCPNQGMGCGLQPAMTYVTLEDWFHGPMNHTDKKGMLDRQVNGDKKENRGM